MNVAEVNNGCNIDCIIQTIIVILFLPLLLLLLIIIIITITIIMLTLGPKRDEVTGGWRKLHNEELRYLYSSPSIIRIIKSRRMRWAGHIARMGEKRNAYRLLVGKPEGKRPLGRPRRRWVYNIKIDLLEIGWGSVDWIGLAQDRDKWRAHVNAVMNVRIP
jgi:hypothetical protein